MTRQNSSNRIITDLEELSSRIDTHSAGISLSHIAARDFPLRVPESWVDRINLQNTKDPLLRQILPLQEEETDGEGYEVDPVGDAHAELVPGLLHKYEGRVLLVLTGACAIHCRYCFRRHYPYNNSSIKPSTLNKALAYLKENQSINEIILSGGDPLSLSDSRLDELMDKIITIKHIKRLRIHSRIPIVTPERITEHCLEWMSKGTHSKILIVHVNHAQELNADVKKTIAAIKRSNFEIMNQSVLLKGVNDSVSALSELSEKLFEYGILPYYLHQLDKVKGASHYAVSDHDAANLHEQLMQKLPGYLVPKLVRELAGAKYKIPILSTD